LAKYWRSCQRPGGPVGVAAPGPTDASRLSGGSLPRARLPALLLPAPTLTVDLLPADDRRECRSPVKEGGVGEVRLAATASADELTRGQTRRRRRHSIAGRRSVGRPWRTVFPSQPAATGRSSSPGQPLPSKTGPGRGPGVRARLLKGPPSLVPTRTRKRSEMSGRLVLTVNDMLLDLNGSTNALLAFHGDVWDFDVRGQREVVLLRREERLGC